LNGPGKLSPAAAALSHKRAFFAHPDHPKRGRDKLGRPERNAAYLILWRTTLLHRRVNPASPVYNEMAGAPQRAIIVQGGGMSAAPSSGDRVRDINGQQGAIVQIYKEQWD
jgi:hypothetical protein